MQTDNESNVIVGAKRRRRSGIPTRSCRWRDRHSDRYHGAGLQPRRRPRRGARGQGREEFGSESGPLKLRQLPGLLLGFLDKRQAWKRWPEESGRNYGGNPGQKAGEGQWRAVARDSAGGAGRRVRASGCGLLELDLEGEERLEEVGANEVGDGAIAGAVQVLVRPIAAENNSTICRSFFGPNPGFILRRSQSNAATWPTIQPPELFG